MLGIAQLTYCRRDCKYGRNFRWHGSIRFLLTADAKHIVETISKALLYKTHDWIDLLITNQSYASLQEPSRIRNMFERNPVNTRREYRRQPKWANAMSLSLECLILRIVIQCTDATCKRLAASDYCLFTHKTTQQSEQTPHIIQPLTDYYQPLIVPRERVKFACAFGRIHTEAVCAISC
jgi:hypothetical protein